MKLIIVFFFFLIFAKLFLFWLWLWQLKEYHLGRFLAHFKEGQAVKKIISSFWRLKYPKFTKKVIAIFFTGALLALLTLKFDPSKLAPLYIFTLIIFVPLFFQIITVIWRKRLLRKARLKREGFKNLLVIGITGSYGKTSTKEFLYGILSQKFRVLATKEHQNSEVGIAGCILNELKPEHEIFIVEMGAYNKGGIKLLCDMVHPKIGILTGINEQHMATFGSQENIIKTKYELIESLPQDGMAFFNAKNKYCVELYNRTEIKKFLYGLDATFFGQENILGAQAVARELGITAENSSQPKFLSMRRGINGLNIIDSTYSANPTGVIAHLDYLKTLRQAQGKLIIVMPCLIELGSASKDVHRRIGQKISEVCDLAIITTEDRFKEIHETAGDKAIFIESPIKIFERIKSFAREGDVVLLESRVPNKLISLLHV
ncbi:MAG: Mur ligase family protein [bacterium]|nr:Mur ligase family protein [bacterium]